MRVVGNVLWLLVAGLWLTLSYLLAGVVACLSVVGIPFGIQSFKLAGYALWPFGRVVVDVPGRDRALGCLGNAAWLLLGGWWLALFQVALAVVFFVTIVGIPFGIACVRMAALALFPFGKTVVSQDEVPPGARVVAGPIRRRP